MDFTLNIFHVLIICVNAGRNKEEIEENFKSGCFYQKKQFLFKKVKSLVWKFIIFIHCNYYFEHLSYNFLNQMNSNWKSIILKP